MNEADKRRVEDNYFIKLGRQISGDPYLEPQLAIQLGRERFAGFKGMPSTRDQFNPLKGNIASVSEDVPMDVQIPENIDAEYDKVIASGMEEFGDADPNFITPPEMAEFNLARDFPNELDSGMPRSELASRVKSMDLSGKSMPPQTMFDDELATGQLALDMGYGGENVPIKQPSALAGSDYVDFSFPNTPPTKNDVLTSPASLSVASGAMAPTGMDFESENMVGQTLPMTAKADNWYDSFSKNFNKDASSDAFLLGSQLINTYDKDPLLGRDVGGGSLAGITQGGLTGAGLGSQFGPKGALIGAGIGATAGLLGGFDRSSPEPYTETKIIRGAGMAFPQMQSSNYYQGLI